MFDGFCDGFSVQWGSNNVVYGTETGCATGSAVGARGIVIANGGTGALVLNLAHVPGGIYVIRKDHTWSIYLADGSELQSGTWSTVAAAKGGALPTGSR